MEIDKETVVNLLLQVKTTMLIGASNVETINFVLSKGLLERTEIGNFHLSVKATDLLEGRLEWDSL